MKLPLSEDNMPNSPTAALFAAAVTLALQCGRAAKTTKALGLNVSPQLQQRADEVIE